MGENVKKLREHIDDLFRQGEIHCNAGKLKETVDFYQEAYNTARKLNDDEIERICAFNLGMALIAIQDAKAGLNYLFKAKTPIRDDSSSNGDLYYNLGLAYEILQETTTALEYFKDAYLEFKNHETEKHDMQIACLEKCLNIYMKQKDYKTAVETCKLMTEVYGKEDVLKRVEYLCKMARHIRIEKKSIDEETKAVIKNIAVECMSLLDIETEQEKTRNEAVKYLNDIGLMLTQIQEYDSAWECLKKADLLLSGSKNVQLLAVVKQNLGATMNFRKDYRNALKIHDEAIKLYAQLQLRNGQGQCFINLAFAQSQFGTSEGMHQAEIAYHHAWQAAKDSHDKHMTFQALEGLGDVCYNLGNLEGSEKHFLDALKLVGDNEVASERISQKLKITIASTISSNKMFNLPVDGRSILNVTARPTSKMQPGSIESKIIPGIVALENTQRTAVTLPPAMPKSKLVPMRKVNSIGPHFPKRAQGLGTIGTDMSYSSQHRSLLETKGEMTEESSDSLTDEETDSEEDGSDSSDGESAGLSNATESCMSETVEQIFQRPTVPRQQLSETRPTTADPMDAGLKQYEEVLREKSANEENFSSQHLETYHDKADDDDDDDEDNDDTDDDDEEENSSEENFANERKHVANQPEAHQKHIQRPQSPQTVSTSSPIPVLANVVVKPSPDKAADISAHLQHSIHDPIGEEDEDEESDSYSDTSDSNEHDDEQPPYASIDTSSKQSHLQPMNGHGNETLDTDDDEIEDHYQELDIQKSLQPGRHGHDQAGENEKPPDLPQRTDENKSKSCTVM